MNHDHYSDKYIRSILESVKTIAIVGASANTSRPSFFVTQYMISKNYEVFPINPGQAGNKIAGAECYASLKNISQPIHMVDVFRNSDAAFGVVEEALELEPLPKVIWMQLQVRNDEAAKLAEDRGVQVVMNRCPKIEYARLCGEIGWAGVATGVISSKKTKLQDGYQRYDIAKK